METMSIYEKHEQKTEAHIPRCPQEKMPMSPQNTSPVEVTSEDIVPESETISECPESEPLQQFTSPDEFSDITVMVEEKPIYTHKLILSLASPVWLAMFSKDFKEGRSGSVELPGKSYDEVVELLQFVYPPCKKTINESNVYRILPLSNEYQIKWLKNSCEDFLVEWILHEGSCKRAQSDVEFARLCVQHLYLGQLYSLPKMLSTVVDMAADIPFAVLKTSEMFKDLECTTLCAIFEKREKNLEQQKKEAKRLEAAMIQERMASGTGHGLTSWFGN